jgi:predicted amidohydrolase
VKKVVGAVQGGKIPSETKDEFLIVERFFSEDEDRLSLGIANIQAVVPDIQANKDKMARAVEIFKDKKVNMAVFPEFSLSGYFWEDERECRQYMHRAVTQNHMDWLNGTLKPMLDENLKVIVFNNLRMGPERKYFNSTFLLTETHDPLNEEHVYNKVFLPPLEKIYTDSGLNARLVLDTRWGKFGFTTSYDVMFPHLLLEYARIDQVDAIVQVAAWRAEARRDYPGMNVGTDTYYGDLWDMILGATSAMNQVWTIGCNAVGIHGVTGDIFWGGSGLWAPSGMRLVQGSRFHEELLIIHNVDIQGQRELEKDDFNYAVDFESIYHLLDDMRAFSRMDE